MITHKTHYGRERGTALLVALVMIFMLSIMGISAMRSSTLESRMAANSIQASSAFQAAESSTEIMMNDPANLVLAWTRQAAVPSNNPGTDPNNRVDINTTDQLDGDDISMVTDAKMVYVGDGPAPGFSLGQGNNNFMSLRFKANGTGNITAVQASAEVEQGSYRIVPAP